MKKIIFLTLATALTIAIVACNSKSDSKPPTVEQPSATPTATLMPPVPAATPVPEVVGVWCLDGGGFSPICPPVVGVAEGMPCNIGAARTCSNGPDFACKLSCNAVVNFMKGLF